LVQFLLEAKRLVNLLVGLVMSLQAFERACPIA
jgi:hypothetical protein